MIGSSTVKFKERTVHVPLPDVRVSATSVRVTPSMTSPVTFTNAGEAPLTVRATAWPTQLAGTAPSFTVAPGATHTLNVSLATGARDAAASIAFATNDPDRATLTLPLTVAGAGTGTGSGTMGTGTTTGSGTMGTGTTTGTGTNTPGTGPTATVKLRATEKGYYGYPVPDIIEAGTVFPFRVGDLEAGGAHAGRGKISIGGTVYDLPSWCEDAKTPVVVPDD